MAIIGIPFGGETLLASEWRDKCNNKRNTILDFNFTCSDNNITIKGASRASIGAFELEFTSNMTLTLPASHSSTTEYYIYITSNQDDKSFSELKYSITEPVNSNQEGLFDIILGKVKVYPGVTTVNSADITWSQAYYNITENNGDAIKISNWKSVIELPTGIYGTSYIEDIATPGIVIVVTYGSAVKKYLNIGNDGSLHYAAGNTLPINWNESATVDDISDLAKTSDLDDYALSTTVDGNLSSNSGLSLDVVLSNNGEDPIPTAHSLRRILNNNNLNELSCYITPDTSSLIENLPSGTYHMVFTKAYTNVATNVYIKIIEINKPNIYECFTYGPNSELPLNINDFIKLSGVMNLTQDIREQ